MTKKIPFFRQYYTEKSIDSILKDVENSLRSSQLMMGPNTDKVETIFAEKFGSKFAVTLNSCTSALHICLKYLGAENSEVLVPSASFITDVSAIQAVGGTPVFVDINPETLSFDLKDLKRKITAKTRGILWVHLLGFISYEHEQIKQICEENNFFLIEDAAHALGSRLGGNAPGSFGDAACYSFYPTKMISCGSGGILTTNNEQLAKTARQLRLFGYDKDQRDGKYWHPHKEKLESLGKRFLARGNPMA